MADQKTDFIIQAALLDKYIKLGDLSKDASGVSVVTRRIKESQDLLRYFLGQSPSPAWARQFYENGFFDNPLNVVEVGNGFQTPYWGMSAYLKSIAKNVPDVVELIVSEIETNNPTIHEDLLEAMSELPPERTVIFTKKIISWLENKYVHFWGLVEAALALAYKWIEKGFIKEAIEILASVLEPISGAVLLSDDIPIGGEGHSRVELDYLRPNFWKDTLPKFGKLAYSDILILLENTLLKCIGVELSAKGKKEDFSSGLAYWWRPAIADHEQNYVADSYKDKILEAFRDHLEAGIKADENHLRLNLLKYLNQEIVILRRIAIYILARYPSQYIDLAWALLENVDFHSDLKFHNDYFSLLASVFPYLTSEQRFKILAIIHNGPLEERVEGAEKFAKEIGYDVEKYLKDQKNYWIRDRLWVIKECLAEEDAALLSSLCEEYGEPDHPGFLSWSSGGTWIRDVSPLPKEQLQAMSSHELFNFVKDWKADASHDFSKDRVSIAGLSKDVAEILLENPKKYQMFFENIDQVSQVVVYTLLNKAEENLRNDHPIPWAELLDIVKLNSEKQSVNQMISKDILLDVRLAGIRLVEEGFGNHKNTKVLIPVELCKKTQEIIQDYLVDSHPSFEDDHPQENMAGYRDPITVSLNSVRPIAFICFMEFIRHSLVEKDWGECEYSWALEILENKLDKNNDASLAVHSIYGRYYWFLGNWNYLWLQKNLSRIFPINGSVEDIDFFLAAWDSFVLYNRIGHQTISQLRKEYSYGISLLSQGKTLKTHLDIPKQMFIHIFLDYLWNPYTVNDDRSVLYEFMTRCDDSIRGQAIHGLVEMIRNTSKEEIKNVWKQVFDFWIWRANEFSLSKHPSEMEKEIERFSLLLKFIPSSEKIVDIQMLLNPFFDFIGNGLIWRELEEFLAQRVLSEPIQTAKMYLRMHEKALSPSRRIHLYYGEESDMIINNAIKNLDARRDVLVTIDLIFRHGNDRYRNLYEEYS